ncbi:hypothetical protein [Roseivivax sp. CAU 1753]
MIIDGFALPDTNPELTDAELAWVTFLRSIAVGQVPRPTLKAVQALRQVLNDAKKEG